MTRSDEAASAQAEPEYILGHTQAELQRLVRQGEFYEHQTRLHLLEAGIAPGQRVLDFGCGAGDVSLLLSPMVGPKGRVIGVDRALEGIKTARARAHAKNLHNIEFFNADDLALMAMHAPESFDAVVGRIVLMYQSDPVATLKRLKSLVRPGGVVMFEEAQMCLGWQGTYPRSSVFDQIWHWVSSVCGRAGIELNAGMRLRNQLLAAGFENPRALLMGRVEGGPDSPVYEYLAETVRSMIPAILRFGIATAEEIHIETLAERLRAETLAHDGAIVASMLVGVSARTPQG